MATAVLQPGSVTAAFAAVEGQAVNDVGTWSLAAADDTGAVGFVSGAFTFCVDPDAPRLEGYFLPIACGQTVRISQGESGGFSHTGASAFALDFGIPRGTPLLAMDDGVVVAESGATMPGHPCSSFGGPECINAARSS